MDVTITTTHWAKSGAKISARCFNKWLTKTSSSGLITNEGREYILLLIKTAPK
jgi:hypothetical protein